MKEITKLEVEKKAEDNLNQKGETCEARGLINLS